MAERKVTLDRLGGLPDGVTGAYFVLHAFNAYKAAKCKIMLGWGDRSGH